MSRPIISVVVCTYNRSYLLAKCLESLIDQKVDKNIYEIVIIDNNSTDDTQKIAKGFVNNQTNIRIVTEKNLGRNQARNRGWKETKGKYVAYIDDDALAGSDWIKQIVIFIKNNPKINVFGGPYGRFFNQPIPDWFPKKWGTLNLGNKIKILNLRNEWISGSNMIFNRLIFYKYGDFNTYFGGKGDKIIYGDEIEFLMRLKKTEEPIFYVPKIRVKHLVAERKLHLWWLLKSDYLHSFSYSILKKPKFNFLRGVVSFILALLLIPIYLIDLRKGVIKRRLYYGLSNTFLSLGQIAGSIHNLSIKLYNHQL